VGPSSPPISDELVDVLRRSQELGFLGARPIEQVIDHARSFVTALAVLDVTGPVLDLGAGGGVPGLVIAHDHPDQMVTLLDRRRTRTDFLARMVRRLGWQDRVDVWNRDADDVTDHDFDAVVARGFGPPHETLAAALAWVRPEGFVVISEPPTGDRWANVMIPGATRLPSASTVSVFQRSSAPSPG
jgi:16S rRNA (guanine527-N7)-methyltransferase